jgi:hypothetical protein
MKWGVWCIRGAGSVFGSASAWAKGSDGKVFQGTQAEAEQLASDWNKRVGTANVRYVAKPLDFDPTAD